MQNNNDANGAGGDVPPQEDTHKTSPSPDTTENGSTGSVGRYIPPQKRNGGLLFDGSVPISPIIRPESSMSNSTFLSQAPLPQILTPLSNTNVPVNPFLTPTRGQAPPMSPVHANSLRSPFMHPTGGVLPPSGTYRYGSNSHVPYLERYEASLAQSRNSPSVQRYNGGRTNASSTNITPTRGGRISFRTGGRRPGFGNSPGIIGSGMGPRPQSTNIAAPTPRRVPSMADSTIDVEIYDKDCAVLADLIKAGCADDPDDVDYGNPGPSNRPDKIYDAILKERQPSFRRGQVAAAASNESNANSPDAVVRAANIRGNPTAFVAVRELPLPVWYRNMDRGIGPVIEEVYNDLPVFEACGVAQPSTAGVIRIRNIPYLISKSEILAFLGGNAQIISQPVGTHFMAIHIMICRLSGRTLDCFVEVDTPQEASHLAHIFRARANAGRHVKLGGRHVAVEESSQQDMMAEMFPRAKNCTWHGPVPVIDTDHEKLYEGVYSMGFNGFLLDEDYAHMIKHCEMPDHGKYIGRCLVRAYDCIIYTIHKFPWFAVEHVLLWERDELFKVAFAGVKALMEILRKPGANTNLDKNKPNASTLKELIIAILTCPGFTESQKASVIARLHQGSYGQYTTTRGYNVKFGGVDDYSRVWPFIAICKKPGVNDQVLDYLAELLRNATNVNGLCVADMRQLQTSGTYAYPFGQLEIDYTGVKTLAEAARIELHAIHEVLRLVLPTEESRRIATDPAYANPTAHGPYFAARRS